MAVTCSYTEADGVVVKESGKPIYQAKTAKDLTDLLGVLYFAMLTHQLASINGATLEHLQNQTELLVLVSLALEDNYAKI